MTARATATPPALRITGLRKAFGDRVVLDGIDLEIAEGTVFPLLGPNGVVPNGRVGLVVPLTGLHAVQTAARPVVRGRRRKRDEPGGSTIAPSDVRSCGCSPTEDTRSPMTTSGTPNGGGEAAGEDAAVSAHPALGSASETVVLATFANRHAAEHMLASLGRDFRRKARRGGVAAYLITGNADGSFSLVQSRVLTAGGVVAAGIGVTVASMAGLLGMMSALRGGKTMLPATRERQTHPGADDQRLRDVLAQPGRHASLLVVRCADPAEAAAVLTQAAQRARDTWQGSRAEFLAGVDASVGTYDWVLAAFDEPPKASG